MTRHVLMPHPGLSKGIGYYLSGMEEVRSQLTEAVKVIPDRGRNGRQMVSYRGIPASGARQGCLSPRPEF